MHLSSLFSTMPELRLRSALALVWTAIVIACSCTLATTPAQAQEQEECHLGTCEVVTVYNYTDLRYKINFKVCCNHTTLVTGCTVIPASGESSYDFPHSCRLLNWRFCEELPDGVCYEWYPEVCVLKIYYCP